MYAALAADSLSDGHTWGSDVLLLAATILFVIAALLSIPVRTAHTAGDTHVRGTADVRAWVWFIGFLGLAALALGWMIL